MHPTDTMMSDEQQSRLPAWHVIRWLITAAASLVLVTLFLTQTASTEAAAPAPTDTVVYHEIAATTCQQGYNCVIQNCTSGNYYFCSYNLGFNYSPLFNYGYSCGFGTLNCGSNYIAPAIYNYPFYNGFTNGVYRFPYFIGANSVCASGNFSCLNANGVCAAGNFSCYNATFPFFGFGYPFSTGVFNGNANVVAPNGTTFVLGAPYRVKEVAQPTTVPAVSQPAAPVVAPAANTVTALNAPAQVPTTVVTSGDGSGVHALSVAPATTPTVTADPDDHRG